MSRKLKFPTRWKKQWFIIELYKPIGFLRRTKFFVRATTYRTAIRKFRKYYPESEVLSVSNIAGDV